MRTHLAFVLGFGLVACGGGSGGGSGTGAIGQAEGEELCTIDCQKDIDCGLESDLASCVQSCTEDFVGWARADAVRTIFNCVAELPCGAGDDTEDLAVCESTLGEGDAGLFTLIAPEIMEEILTCLDEAICDDRLNCIIAVLETHNINF
jgi:hypothetical protein